MAIQKKKVQPKKSNSARQKVGAKHPSPKVTEEVFLCNQICFSLYTTLHHLTRAYQPLLDQLEVTYPQYLVLLSLWEKDAVPVTELCRKLQLDTGTISPILKKLENKNYVTRKRSRQDERIVHVHLTAEGLQLRVFAEPIKNQMVQSTGLAQADLLEVKKQLDHLSFNFAKIIKV